MFTDNSFTWIIVPFKFILETKTNENMLLLVILNKFLKINFSKSRFFFLNWSSYLHLHFVKKEVWNFFIIPCNFQFSIMKMNNFSMLNVLRKKKMFLDFFVKFLDQNFQNSLWTCIKLIQHLFCCLIYLLISCCHICGGSHVDNSSFCVDSRTIFLYLRNT